MTHLLPPNLLRLFAPRPPLEYLKPTGRDINKPITAPNKLTGVASLLETLKQEEATQPDDNKTDSTPATDTEHLKYLKRQEERKAKKEASDARQRDSYDPTKDSQAQGDPYKSLFISKLSKDATEEDLRREFAMYGHIDNLRIVRDSETGKSKGYAFILYEREKDLKAAYKDAEGIKILGKRILVDVERGRTVKDWKPMRLGGGLGGRPKPAAPQDASYFAAGGFRGGFRGRGGNIRANDRVGGGYRGGGPPRGGGGFRGGGRGGGYGDRPSYGGDRDRQGGGYDRPPSNYDRPPSSYDDRGPSRGGYAGRGRGIGYGGEQEGAGGYGQKRDYDNANGFSQGGSGGYGARPPAGGYDQRGGGGGGYQQADAGWGGDRDSKRPRY